jgi:hypothetical protein|tara:strand:- start:700 stop:1197 length:498 start_codon:yes stop_codon:yes gene_type:complete
MLRARSARLAVRRATGARTQTRTPYTFLAKRFVGSGKAGELIEIYNARDATARRDASSSSSAAAPQVMEIINPVGGGIDPGVVEAMEGNQAAAHVAYSMTDNAFIYPISPATSMGEYMDAWRSQGRKNCFGEIVDVNTMQVCTDVHLILLSALLLLRARALPHLI